MENAIGRMRRALPSNAHLATVPPKRFTRWVQAYNNTPRKRRGYRKPAEIFASQVLHLAIESSFPPTRE